MEVPILEGWEGGGGGGGGVGGLPNTTPAWGLSEIWNEIKSLGHASWGVGEIVLPYERGGGGGLCSHMKGAGMLVVSLRDVNFR